MRTKTGATCSDEAHLGRQLYQAKHELEILQKQRRGEATPIARLDIGGQISQ